MDSDAVGSETSRLCRIQNREILSQISFDFLHEAIGSEIQNASQIFFTLLCTDGYKIEPPRPDTGIYVKWDTRHI
jgi:hypothetical protein